MKPSPSDNPADDLLLELLLAHDVALAQGTTLSAVPLPAEMEARRAAAARALERLHRAWPQKAEPAPEALTPPQGGDSEGLTVLQGYPAAPPAEGTGELRLGRFHILRELGRGGFGLVYLAYDPNTARLVALKVPRPGFVADPQVRRRFLREAQAAAGLDHPHLVPVYEAGEVGPVCYIAAKYCPGRTLADWLKAHQGPVPSRRAAHLIATLADAVHYTHSRGVLHRDLKPGNILLEETGEGTPGEEEADWPRSLGVPRVCDFGLARSVEDVGDETRTGALVGTPAYMAPEQAAGLKHDVSVATDVYALGVILYECLTGRKPFQGESQHDTLEQILAEPPAPPRRLAPSVPRDLETICLKCLEKDPARRYGGAAELADDLRRFLHGEPIRARPVGAFERCWRWCRRRPAKAALLGSGLLVAFVVLPGWLWYQVRLDQAQDRARLIEEVAESHREARKAAEEAAESDRKARAAAEEAAQVQRFYRLLLQVKERRSRRPAGWTWDNRDDLRRAVRLNPSGDNLPTLRSEAAACLAGIDLRLTQAVAPGFAARQVAFSPDGRLLALAQNLGPGPLSLRVLLLDPVSGRTVRELTYPSNPFWQVVAGGRAEASNVLRFSPDGRWLVVGTRSGQLHRWDLREDKPRAVSWPGHKAELLRLEFSTDGTLLYSLSKDDVLKRWDAVSWREAPLLGLPPKVQGLAAVPTKKAIACLVGGLSRLLDERTLREVRGPVASPVTGLCPSPSGTTFVGQRDGRLHLHDLAGGEHLGVLPGSEGTAWDDGLAFSPDGRLVVCVVSGTRRLKVWDVAGGRLEADVVVSKALNAVAFHPDGRSLAVAAEDQTFLYELNGGGGHAMVAQHAAAVRDLAVSADGRTLATLAEARLAGAENVLALWPLGGRLPVSPSFRWEMRGPARDFHTLALHPRGSAVCCTSEKKVLCREPSGGRTYTCGSFDSELKRLCFAPDGTLWAAAGHEIRCGQVPPGLPPVGLPRQRVALSVCFQNEFSARDAGSVFYSVAAGRHWALAGRRDGTLFLFDAAARRPCAPWQVCTSPIWSVALSPEERLALVGTELGKLRLLSLPSGEVVKDFPDHGDCVTGVAFAGAGLLVSASQDGTVRLWRPDGEPLLTLAAPGPMRKISVVPDGSQLALLVEGERAVRLWHLDRLAVELADLGLPLNLPHLK